MNKLRNPFELSGKWYKANLHTHTTTSDGKASPAERVEQYRRAGYDILAITDHRVTNDIRGLGKRSAGKSGRKILVISGVEYSPVCPTKYDVHHIHHIVAINVPHPFDLSKIKDANRCIRKVKAVGGENILAHPLWSGHSFHEFKHLKGLAAMEVYNSSCVGVGRESSENEWTHALDRGMMLPCVGVDDTHSTDGNDVCATWTWLKMPRLTVAEVLKAVRTGAGYASRGPKIHDFRFDGVNVKIRCSPVKSICFMTPPGWGSSRRAEPGKTITSFSMGMPNRPYVRAVITDANGRKAWSNPLML